MIVFTALVVFVMMVTVIILGDMDKSSKWSKIFKGEGRDD